MKKLALISLLNVMLFASEFDSGDGAPIRQGVHIEWYRTVAPGNDGEAVFVWSDTRYGMRNIFAHKVNGDGELLWGDNGAVVTDLPGRQEDPVAITDGSGGVFIAWVDYRFDEQGDIFFQHLDNNGSILLDADGVALAQVVGKQITINMCTDSLGGVFVTWQDKRGGVHDDIYGTHISADHSIVAPGSGVPIVDATGDQNSKTIEYAGDNQAFIAWADFREGSNADVYAQRLDISMNSLFQDNGLPVASTEQQELKPRATFVNETTSFIAWKVGDDNSKILYQFVDEDGLVFNSARSISENTALQTAPRVKRSAVGEVFVNWKDLRNDPINGDQYFQKVDVSGDIQWGEGVRMDLFDDIDFSARFSAGVEGDLNIIWERGTFPNVDIYFQNINSDGGYTLEEAVPISADPNYQFAPILVGNAQDGLFSIYGDKAGGSIDLKVQKLGSNLLPQWEQNGITAMEGLDGDIKYTDAYRISDEDIYLIWEDNRASKKIYGSRITELELSDVNGKQVSFSDNSSSETDFSTPKTLYTSTGLYIATFDGLTGEKYIRINRLNDQLENLWDDNGINFSSNGMAKLILAESSNGISCFWSEISAISYTYDIFYQSIDSDGNILLENEGVDLIESSADDYIMAVVPTPDDKYMIFWMEDIWGAALLKFTKIDQQGNTEIGWNPNGNNLSNSNFDSRNLQAKAINNGSGVLATWVQDGNFSDIYAQSIDWNGNIQFEIGGIPIVEADNDQVELDYTFNEAGTHAFMTWQDFRNGSDFEIYGEILSLNDGSLMTQENIQFSLDTTNQYNPKVVSVQDNEFLIVWEDERGYYNVDPLLINGVDLYGSGYVIGRGMTTDINGIPICIAYHKQQNINITKHQGEEYFLDWIDYRSSGKEDLANYYGRTLMKADLLSSIPCDECNYSLPQSFSLINAYPNPFNGMLNFTFELPGKQAVEFSIYDLKGSKIYDRLILPGVGGIYNINWAAVNNSGQSIPSGIYIYEFVSNNDIIRGKTTYLK